MGKVFTFEEIEEGRVPRPENFNLVASRLREELLYESSVVCALLFGSVVRGDSTIRSDVDCVVVYDVQKEKSAVRVMHRLNRFANTLHIPINYTPCDTAVARTYLHALGKAFVQHLQAAIDAGGIIKGNLVDILAPTMSATQEVESYISRKMFSLMESYAEMSTYSEERLFAFLKKALEAPMHVARKMLIYEGTMQGDSKREVQEQYKVTMPMRLVKQFEGLQLGDSLYTKELKHQIKHPNEVEYKNELLALRMQLPYVLEFIRGNIQYLDAAR